MYASLVLGLALSAGGAAGAGDPPRGGASVVGRWVIERVTVGGEDRPIPAGTRAFEFTADGKVVVREGEKATPPGDYTADPGKDPAAIDITPPDPKTDIGMTGIYKVEGDTLTICARRAGTRPTRFESPKGSGLMLMVLTRLKRD